MDSPGPRPDRVEEIREFNLESESNWLWQYLPGNEIKEKVKQAKSIDEIWTMTVNYFKENHLDIEKVRQLLDRDVARIIPHFHQLGIRELLAHFNTNRSLTRARALYFPSKKINTPLHFFAASESLGIFQESWRDYCMEPIKSSELSGDHFSIFKLPHVVTNAKIIGGIFNQ